MSAMEVIARAAIAEVRLSAGEGNSRLRVGGHGDMPKPLMDRIRDMRDEILAGLGQGAQGRLDQARERHAPFLRIVEAARPPDVSEDHWKTAIDGLKVFLLSGWGAEAERLGWPSSELYDIPPTWSRVDLCGAALLIGDCEVVEITATAIRIRTASGAVQSFYRRPAPDFGLVFRERFKLLRRDVIEDEAWARSYDFTIASFCSHHGCGLEAAKQAVTAAIKRGAA